MPQSESDAGGERRAELEWPLRITLPGEPIGKGRPRVRVLAIGGKRPFPQLYTDSRTRDYEKALATVAVLAMRGRQRITGPVALVIGAHVGVPKSWGDAKRRRVLEDNIHPTGKPDWDNISKVCCDALNKIVWNDDAQVFSVNFLKMYSDNPRLEVWITPG